METGFKHIDEYYVQHRPEYGQWILKFDVKQFLPEAHAVFADPQAKRSGRNDFNRFNKTSTDTRKFLSQYWNQQLGLDYDWNWEYFHSGEPAGLHTDYLSFENSWKPKPTNIITHDCHVVLGVIIPLEWNSAQPYTVNYDRVAEQPRKLIYRRGEMRYMDTDEIVNYRSANLYDPMVERFNPPHTQYHREYADLKFHSAFKWHVGRAMVFDTARWHSSSWFLTTPNLPEVSTEYKRSIIGFASVDVDR